MTLRLLIGAGLGIAVAGTAALGAEPALADGEAVKPMRVYIGTYTTGPSKGIYLFDFDPATGKLEPAGLAGEVANPSFLAIHPSRRFLYAAGEIQEFSGQKSGAVSAFAIDPKSGKLRLLNQQPSGGRGPCHVSIDAAGKYALAANYSTGSAAVLPIHSDGSLARPSSVVQHEGSGPNPKRQEGPHAHSINLDPAGRFAFVADLGLDRLFVYRFDAKSGKLAANDPPSARVAPGSGPRHFAFHPTGKFAYTNLEIASCVTAFTYDPARGVLTDVQTVSTLPPDFDRESNSTAEVQVHPSGKFLYCSNRGHDSIAVFSIDPADGTLAPVGHASTRGKTPRNFGIDPTGKWLIAANQKSDSLVVFRISQATGMLSPAGETVSAPIPVCVKFLELDQ